MSSAARIAVVTDSTAYLPDGVAEKYEIETVPLDVVLPDRTGAEGRDVLPDDVARALSNHKTVTTSRPSPEAFAATYRRLAEEGARGIVSVHLSARLSGTWDAARLAGEQVDGIEVRIVDSRTTAMGLGFAVMAAAEAAAAAASAEEVEVAAAEKAEKTRTLFYVDTLEHLRRGGRIGAAAALVGTALSVKPLLHVVEGGIAVLEKVRTATRALQRLEDVAVEAAGAAPVDVAVHHLTAEARATTIADHLRTRIPGLQSLYTSKVGAVVGAHAGPGLLGVVVSPR
jgi:DegV family protein with EDD domain